MYYYFYIFLSFFQVGLADGRRGKPRGKPDMVYYDLLGVVRQASDRDIRKVKTVQLLFTGSTNSSLFPKINVHTYVRPLVE